MGVWFRHYCLSGIGTFLIRSSAGESDWSWDWEYQLGWHKAMKEQSHNKEFAILLCLEIYQLQDEIRQIRQILAQNRMYLIISFGSQLNYPIMQINYYLFSRYIFLNVDSELQVNVSLISLEKMSIVNQVGR